MTIAEIANRFVQMVREGKSEEIRDELYSPNIVSVEAMPQSPDAIWFDGLKKKSEQWTEMVEEFHGMTVSDPLIADDHFAVMFEMDIAYKGAPRSQEKELAVYHVKDGKIDAEEYIYDIPEI